MITRRQLWRRAILGGLLILGAGLLFLGMILNMASVAIAGAAAWVLVIVAMLWGIRLRLEQAHNSAIQLQDDIRRLRTSQVSMHDRVSARLLDQKVRITKIRDSQVKLHGRIAEQGAKTSHQQERAFEELRALLAASREAGDGIQKIGLRTYRDIQSQWRELAALVERRMTELEARQKAADGGFQKLVEELRQDLRESSIEITGKIGRTEALAEESRQSLLHLSTNLSQNSDYLQGAAKDIVQRQLEHTASHKDAVAKSAENLAETIKRDLSRASKDIYRRIDQATITAAKQVEAYIGVHSYLATGELPSLSTEGHAWPVSPDFAQYLIELIDTNEYDAIVEFGSGISTLVMAKVLARKLDDCTELSCTPLTSFDHLEQYFSQTLDHLERARLSNLVDLKLAPLVPYKGPDGAEYLYYDCLNILRDLSEQCTDREVRVLVVVDGPPGDTGKHARYPALPMVLSCFRSGRVDFLLDDYARPDEMEVVVKWEADLSSAGLNFNTAIRKLQKDACLLTVWPRGSQAELG